MRSNQKFLNDFVQVINQQATGTTAEAVVSKTVYRLMHDALEVTRGELMKAVEHAYQTLLRDPDQYLALAPAMLRDGLRRRGDLILASERRKVWDRSNGHGHASPITPGRKDSKVPRPPAPAPGVGKRKGEAERITRQVVSLLDYRMRGGKRLGACSKTEVLADAARYEKASATYGLRGRWFALIARALPTATALVEDHLDHEALRTLKAKARA